MQETFKKYWAQKWFKIALGVLVVLIILAFVGRSKKNGIETATVERDTFMQEVLVQGTVTPADDIELAFDDSGVVARVNVDVGDPVAAGDVLATLGNGDVLAGLAEARAERDAAQERLNELLTGTREEEISVQERRVASAESAVDDARDNFNDTLLDAIDDAEDAVLNRADEFFSNPQTIPSVKVGEDNGVKNQVEKLREDVDNILDRWEDLLFATDLIDEFDVIRSELEVVSQLIGGVAFLISEESNNATELAIITVGQDNVSSARSAIIAAEEKYTASQDSLLVEQEELALLNAGARSEEIRQQEAIVASRQATVSRRYADYQKTIIEAPIDGLVVRRDIDPGESVSAYEGVLKVISGGALQVEADLSELDVSFVEVGDAVNITLDAYGDETVFMGHVIQVDPAETIVDNLPTYGLTVSFDSEDSRVRSGMTANIRIVTEAKEGALMIASSAVTFDAGETVVFVGSGPRQERRVVEVGSYSSDGRVEILSGVSEGDVVTIR